MGSAAPIGSALQSGGADLLSAMSLKARPSWAPQGASAARKFLRVGYKRARPEISNKRASPRSHDAIVKINRRDSIVEPGAPALGAVISFAMVRPEELSHNGAGY